MTTIVWIIVVLVCLAGGIWLGRYTAPGVEKARSMEQERDEAHAELQRYREDVRTHFEKTAHLFNEVTSGYRNLYEHLAEGSERLGTGPSAGMLESKPEDRTLQGPEQAPAQASAQETVKGHHPEASAMEEAARTQESERPRAEQAEAGSASGTQPEAEQQEEADKRAQDKKRAEDEKPRGPATDYAEEQEQTAEEGKKDEAKRAG